SSRSRRAGISVCEACAPPAPSCVSTRACACTATDSRSVLVSKARRSMSARLSGFRATLNPSLACRASLGRVQRRLRLSRIMRLLRPLTLTCLLLWGALAGHPGHAAPARQVGPDGLPAAVAAALRQAKVPQDALSAVVLPVQGADARLAWHGEVMRNPASV